MRNLATGETSVPPSGSYPTFSARYELPHGHVLIQGGIFCGKPAHVKLFIYEEDIPAVAAWLGLSESELR